MMKYRRSKYQQQWKSLCSGPGKCEKHCFRPVFRSSRETGMKRCHHYGHFLRVLLVQHIFWKDRILESLPLMLTRWVLLRGRTACSSRSWSSLHLHSTYRYRNSSHSTNQNKICSQSLEKKTLRFSNWNSNLNNKIATQILLNLRRPLYLMDTIRC